METQAQSTTTATGNILKRFLLKSIVNGVIGVIMLGGLLCLLAGTLNYWQGWVFAILFGILNTAQVIYLGIKDPALLERRKKVAPEGESKAQRIFIRFALASLVCQFIFSALDQRYGWSQMPAAVSLLGDALLVFSYFIYYLVFRENSYAASSIKTFEGQKVISTGPYTLIRHPKYFGDLFLVIGIPIALGSWWSLVFILLTIPGLAWRILDEEKLLKKDLPGYVEYTQKVRYRLVPYLW